MQHAAHGHRCYDVLAPNSPMRAAVTALTPMPVVVPLLTEATVTDTPPQCAASHYLWAMLLARIYETLPLVCPNCNAPMRIISFITEGSAVRKILHHLGEPTQSPSIAPACEPPLWEWGMSTEYPNHSERGSSSNGSSRSVKIMRIPYFLTQAVCIAEMLSNRCPSIC